MFRKLFTLVTASLILLTTGVYSQSGNKTNSGGTAAGKGKQFKEKWKTNPFDQNVFIENKGQFDGKIPNDKKIFYGVHLGKVWAYFTSNGIVYRYDEYPQLTNRKPGNDPDKNGAIKPVVHYLSSNWMGANSSFSIEPGGEQKQYYTYPVGKDSTIKTNIYKTITYTNIYPGIDIVYSFREGKDGLEYSIIVHPGADLSQVKLNYPSLKEMKVNEAGDIVFKSAVGEITEHKPSAYEGSEAESVIVATWLTGNTESFIFSGSYDKTKTIVIDPWLTDPLFTVVDNAYDLDWDYYGNVYVYGGTASTLQFTKMDKTGTQLWTFNATTISGGSYGDFCTDKVTGTSYLIEGFSGGRVLKVNTIGNLLATSPGNPYFDELWRAEYDACNRDIVVAGGGTGSVPNQAGVLDTNMTAMVPVNVLGVALCYHDMSLLTIDPNGTQCYIAAAKSIYVDPLVDNNVFMQCPLPSLSPTAYLKPDSLHFLEINSIFYAGGIANGMNGAVATPNWLYLYNGDTLKRYNKSTGNLSNLKSIRLNTPFVYGGLDADACDNLFVGVQDSIYVMDSTYAILAKIPLQNTIYDLHLGQNNALYACGVGYVAEFTNPAPAKLISTAVGTPTSCSACNGTATVNVNCGVSPYTFLWSNGNTNQTDTGLCAGLYTVSVTDGACPPHSDTAVVNVSGKPGYGASVVDTNPNCALSPGNITVYPYGGTAPYTYSWSNGETNQKDTGLSAGTYICTITDNAGCRYNVVVVLVNPITPKLTIKPTKDSICAGNTVLLTASGLKTYSWTPNSGLTCYSCPNPTASPTATTTYTIAAVDSNGCTATGNVTIKVFQTPKPIITGKDSVCAGYTDTLSVTGGTTYVWSTGATTTTITGIITTTKTITVTATNGMCTHDTSFVVHVISPAAAIVSSKDSVCQGDSILLTASGGTSYIWNNGKTTTAIWVSPNTTTTYTLHAVAGTCSDSATKTLHIFPLTTATKSKDDTVCPNVAVTLTATGSGGPVTYKWNTGATSSSITVSDSVTTIYTVTVFGRCDSVKETIKVNIVPLAKPVIKGTLTKCHGIKDTLTVTGGTSYKWSNGSTKTSYITGPINADSTITVVAYNSLGCPDTTKFTVKLKSPPNGTVTYTGGCSTQPIIVTVTPVGSGPFTYKWNTGATTDTIDVTISTPTTYTVTISNGCAVTKIVTVTPVTPTLLACCNYTVSIGHDTTLVASGTHIKTYQWDPSVICKNPPICDSVIANPTVTTTYTVTGTDSMGCTVERIVTVVVETPCFDFIVPNVFTPDFAGPGGANGGHNNIFYMQTENITGWSTIIYDRWGKEMFKTTDPKVYWDGNTEGGSKAPDGVYFYIISGTCQGNTYKKQGFLQLIR